MSVYRITGYDTAQNTPENTISGGILMDYENQKTNTNPNDATVEPDPATDGNQQSFASDQSFDQLMAQSPTLSPFCGWLKCIRKPALSMQYSIQKRHVPDLDAEVCCQGKSGNAQNGTNAQNKPSGQGSPSAHKGQNSDTMGLTGGFTIRYFDLALGALGLMVLGCVMKGCCCLKKRMF